MPVQEPVVIVDEVRRDQRARGQHRRGESAVLGQLAEVPRGLDSCPTPFYLAGHVVVAFAYPSAGQKTAPQLGRHAHKEPGRFLGLCRGAG
jgi:hypothetical protein